MRARSSCGAPTEQASGALLSPPPLRRDRSYSASRSVQFRAEIGCTPRRDRSSSSSRLRRAWRVWLSSVLHMGDWDLCRAKVVFWRNDGIFRRSLCAAVLLPCAPRGSTHMGAGPRPLPTLLFRMIPRFPPTPNARKCATPTTRGHAGTSRSGLRLSSPTHTTLSPKSHTGNHQTRRTHPLTPSQTP